MSIYYASLPISKVLFNTHVNYILPKPLLIFEAPKIIDMR